jgi:hypothetical protein
MTSSDTANSREQLLSSQFPWSIEHSFGFLATGNWLKIKVTMVGGLVSLFKKMV